MENLLFLFLGGFSGIFSVFLYSRLFPAPGVVLGIYTILAFAIYQKRLSMKALFFVPVSALAYCAAFYTTMIVQLQLHPFRWDYTNTSHEIYNTIDPIALFLGGLVGALILVPAIRFFLFKIKLYQALILIMTGAVLTFSYYITLPLNIIKQPELTSLISLFFFWQAGILGLLGHFFLQVGKGKSLSVPRKK